MYPFLNLETFSDSHIIKLGIKMAPNQKTIELLLMGNSGIIWKIKVQKVFTHIWV